MGGGQVRNSITTYWNVGSQGRLTIPANSNSDYEITGSYTGVGHIITVALGYKGTITLNNVNLVTTNDSSPIMLSGTTGDVEIQSLVTIIIVGDNTLWKAKDVIYSYAVGNNQSAVHISAGARLFIDGSGSLEVKTGTMNFTTHEGGYSAIGASFSEAQYNAMGNIVSTYAGGELIIKGGNITATGTYHGAGIGNGVNGGLRRLIILGGNVKSYGGVHGAGIGGACRPVNQGVLVVLPPTVIESKAGSAIRDDVGSLPNILYLGDPNQKKLRVTAQQLGGTSQIGRKNVNILFDVSDDSIIASALELAGLNPSKWFAGTTEDKGYWETTGKIAGTVKVYSDTFTPRSTEDQKEYYSSKRVAIDGSKDVHVVLEEPDLTMKYLNVTKTPETWNANSVTLRASALAVTPSVVRIREHNGVWVETSNYIERVVTQNGTYYFEAENSDGNTQTVSCVVDNIDKSRPVVKHDSG